MPNAQKTNLNAYAGKSMQANAHAGKWGWAFIYINTLSIRAAKSKHLHSLTWAFNALHQDKYQLGERKLERIPETQM